MKNQAKAGNRIIPLQNVGQALPDNKGCSFHPLRSLAHRANFSAHLAGEVRRSRVGGLLKNITTTSEKVKARMRGLSLFNLTNPSPALRAFPDYDLPGRRLPARGEEIRGFTLIELLIVVLIIGILAAVALPQYQQAVLKSRTVQLQTLADALATAQKVYYMEHGSYAEKFEDLDVSIPTGATITTLTTSQQAKWPNGMIAYTLVDGFTTYVRNEKWRIGIYSWVTGPGHKCQSYNELADQVCLSLGGKYMGTACATTEDLAAGKHGCNIYSFQ